MPQRWNQDVQELALQPWAMRVPLIWCLGCTGKHPREVKFSLRHADNALFKQTGYTTAETLAAYSDLTWHLTIVLISAAACASRMINPVHNTRQHARQPVWRPG